MKTDIWYLCEKCNTRYKKESEALHCENSHAMPVEITESYFYDKNNNRKYPSFLTVSMSDGTVRKYNLSN